MLRHLFLGIATFSLAFSGLYAQSDNLLSNDYWKGNPDLKSVKTEVAKGFDFSNLVGMKDPIMLAMSNGASPEIVNYLIDQPGVDVSRLLVENRIYLHVAANAGKAEVVDHLLEKGSDINFLDGNAHTAFSYAGFQGHLTKEMIDVFVKHGVDLNKTYETKDDANILLISIPYDKDLEITDYLVFKGVSIKSLDGKGNTAFNHAAKIGYVGTMKELVKRGVAYNDNALFIAAQGTYRHANSIDVFQYLVDDLNITPTILDEHKRNVLHYVAKKNDQLAIVNYFLAKGVDVNQIDEDGQTPFMVACGNRSSEVVNAMLPKVNSKLINQKNSDGQTALMLAVEKGDAQTVENLLKQKADVKVKDNKGNTLVAYLVNSYPVAKKGGRGFRGTTIEKEQEKFFSKLNLLKDAGLDFSATQAKGETAYHLAAAKNDVKLLKTLSELNIDINGQDDTGATALHVAALAAENDKILQYLISVEANKQIENEFGETAYDLAKENETLKSDHVSVAFLK
ncbi:ankyrin repeat domain-containing protein [Formosa sp. S-31]|uniref:ankyrin repeat domain-containing protein n=1 Tax=Formosa sp. S-31 TaxID=2790949 RepID=UPI003EBA28C6